MGTIKKTHMLLPIPNFSWICHEPIGKSRITKSKHLELLSKSPCPRLLASRVAPPGPLPPPSGPIFSQLGDTAHEPKMASGAAQGLDFFQILPRTCVRKHGQFWKTHRFEAVRALQLLVPNHPQVSEESSIWLILNGEWKHMNHMKLVFMGLYGYTLYKCVFWIQLLLKNHQLFIHLVTSPLGPPQAVQTQCAVPGAAPGLIFFPAISGLVGHSTRETFIFMNMCYVCWSRSMVSWCFISCRFRSIPFFVYGLS